MSADNWTTCPRCKEKHEKEWAEKVKAVDDLYGKVPVEVFLRKKEAIPHKSILEETFREDYELGLGKDGIFRVSYSGFCRTCNFHFDYTWFGG